MYHATKAAQPKPQSAVCRVSYRRLLLASRAVRTGGRNDAWCGTAPAWAVQVRLTRLDQYHPEANFRHAQISGKRAEVGSFLCHFRAV
jgi:uncharacterized membrane protein